MSRLAGRHAPFTIHRRRVMEGGVIDLGYRLAYKLAYRLMRLYWGALHPETHGALVALWHEGRILLVRTSYHGYWSLPGGYVRRGEPAVAAARRELLEEVGLAVEERALVHALQVFLHWEGKRDTVDIFRLEVPAPPAIAVDRREVVAAELFALERALELELFPPVRQHLEARKAGGAGAP